MFLILDGNGPQYGQLIRAMRTAILSGRIRSGSRLPATRELAQQLGEAKPLLHLPRSNKKDHLYNQPY